MNGQKVSSKKFTFVDDYESGNLRVQSLDISRLNLTPAMMQSCSQPFRTAIVRAEEYVKAQLFTSLQ